MTPGMPNTINARSRTALAGGGVDTFPFRAPWTGRQSPRRVPAVAECSENGGGGRRVEKVQPKNGITRHSRIGSGLPSASRLARARPGALDRRLANFGTEG